jgi:hypothetical protein
MGTLPGWKIDHKKSIAVDASEDVTEGQVGKLTAESTAAVCGAGEMPAGVFPRTVDISEDGARTELVRGDVAVCLAAAAISDLTIPVTTAASGTATPCTVDQEVILGMPLTLQSTVGGTFLVDLTLMGSYYATT